MPNDPTLVGVLCHLRRYRLDDAARLALIANDAEVARWTSRAFPHPYTEDDARAWVGRASVEDPLNTLAIVVDGVLAGGIGLRPLEREESGCALLGYWLGSDYWGRGIVAEACRLLVAYAFGPRNLRRVEADVFSPNTASMRVLEKCGFVHEGTLRQAVCDRDGNVFDSLVYARLRSDEC